MEMKLDVLPPLLDRLHDSPQRPGPDGLGEHRLNEGPLEAMGGQPIDQVAEVKLAGQRLAIDVASDVRLDPGPVRTGVVQRHFDVHRQQSFQHGEARDVNASRVPLLMSRVEASL